MAFRIVDKNFKIDVPLYPHVERKLATATKKGWDKVGDWVLRDKETYGVFADYMPQRGLQESLCRCECNLIFICGSAAGGKTYSMYLKSLYGITHSGFTATMFSYREKDSQRGSSMFRDGVEVLGNFANCDYVSSGNIGFRYPQYNSQLQLANFNYNVNNPAEWSDFKEDMKKRQSSLIMVDEGTNMEEKAMLYLFSRNRDSTGMTPQFIISFNPEYEHFTCNVLNDAGYMERVGDSLAVREDMIGKVRYFYLTGKTFSTAVWGDTPEEVVRAAGITITQKERDAGLTEASLCKSFTVFVSNAAENRKLVYATDGQSVANLAASGDASALRSGLFTPRNNAELNVNRQMIHDLWDNPINGDENMYATMDVSGGNIDSDNCPMCIFKGNSFIAVKTFRGDPKQLVEFIESTLRQYNVPVSNFAFDATGIGNYLRAFTSGVPLTANRKAIQEYDAEGNPVNLDTYFNLRSQLLSRLEVMLQKGELNFAIPKDLQIQYGKKGEYRKIFDIICDELDVLTFSMRNGKRYANSKEEYKAKYKHSPDLLDTIMLIMYFFLDARPKKQPKPQVEDDAYDEIFSPHPLVGWGYY